jgi:D-alanine-D-alanine ligase
VEGRRIAAALRVPGDVVINLVEDDDGDWSVMERITKQLLKSGRAVLGTNVHELAFYMNKTRMKQILAKYKLRTPKFRIIKSDKKIERVLGLEFPLMVKPAGEHASLGISQDSVVIDQQELLDRVEYLKKKFSGDVIVEEYIEGRELHVTVVGSEKNCAVLPYCEIDFRGEYQDNWNVFSYEAKWTPRSWEYWDCSMLCPVVLPKKVEKEIDKLVTTAFKKLRCCDIVRFDLRLDEKNRPWIIEINVLPGMEKAENEECWRSAKAIGWEYEQMIETVVAIAYKRVYGRLPERVADRSLLLAN